MIKLTVLKKNLDLGAEILWQNVQEKIITTEDGYLIFDDTVINKKYSRAY